MFVYVRFKGIFKVFIIPTPTLGSGYYGVTHVLGPSPSQVFELL